MRFVRNPTDGAFIPHLFDKGKEAAHDAAGDVTIYIVQSIGAWLWKYGLPLATEAALVWGCVCLLIAITGNGKWLERGVKSLLASFLLGMVKYAV